MSKNIAQEYYNQLVDCKCCERHQKDRPTSLLDGWIDTKWNDSTQYPDCSCFCRHDMRMMARAWTSEENTDWVPGVLGITGPAILDGMARGVWYDVRDSSPCAPRSDIDQNTPTELSIPNLCVICKIDMGAMNPRQLCGKTKCDNEWLIE